MASTVVESVDRAMQEYCVVDLERIDVPEIDGALLMELLEDSCADAAAEDDRLGGVIRSLEAEIGSNSGSMEIGDDESTTGPADGGLEAVLSDFDSFDGLRDAGYAVEEDPFGWAEMEVGTSAAMGGWYVGVEEGRVGWWSMRRRGESLIMVMVMVMVMEWFTMGRGWWSKRIALCGIITLYYATNHPLNSREPLSS
uniref:Uncharacterized protein n=1 Tax=Ananas comosus var. bracteatus TaxID=296719 RepID=A0A6V7QK23_ANACO|nr:unnamed protein product [Ananas comosus var. bracteatus]